MGDEKNKNGIYGQTEMHQNFLSLTGLKLACFGY